MLPSQLFHHACVSNFQNTVSLKIGRFEIMIHANTQKAADMADIVDISVQFFQGSANYCATWAVLSTLVK